jgi:hypothetical protein
VNPSPATHCVLCGAGASLAPRVHLREVRPGETPRDVALGVCEAHGARLRNGGVRVTAVIEAWLTSEGRFNPANPLDRIRLLAHCLACDAPLGGDAMDGRSGVGDARTHALPTGETVVECGSCPAMNLVEPLGGDAIATQLYTKPIRPPAR